MLQTSIDTNIATRKQIYNLFSDGYCVGRDDVSSTVSQSPTGALAIG